MGGCDGCLNLDNENNNGLGSIFAAINDLYDGNFSTTGMSRADFIALAGVVAVREASCNMQGGMGRQPPPNNNKGCTEPVLEIRYGREDCRTSPTTTLVIEFPNPHSNLDHVMEVFRNGMGMTERQVVALMGAHSLGSCTPENSGFLGPWDRSEFTLNNGFYTELVNSDWAQDRLVFPDPHFQWNTADANITARMPGRMMLNTDMVRKAQ